MKRMITRLIMAQLIPLALRYAKKAFRNRKAAPESQPAVDNTAQPQNCLLYTSPSPRD